jgi:hypothetical protein
VRLIDNYCESRDWETLFRLREACRAATRSGKQVWPASTLAEYRLALRAPAEWAARVLSEDVGRFTIGPLSEVIAQHHTWDELAPLVPASPLTSFVAHECAIRGNHIDGELIDVLEMPFDIQDWEPQYALALYRDNDAVFDSPEVPATTAINPAHSEPLDEPHTLRDAAHQLVSAWKESSNGTLRTAFVDGSIPEALGALAIEHPRIGTLSPGHALAWLTWAGASGGAHSRRRGNAIGRFNAWSLAAALAGIDGWPPDSSRVRDALHSMQWCWWEGDVPATGWRLQLAAYDTVNERAWAICATDSRV